MLTTYGLPALRWLEVTVGDFHAYLGRWVDLWTPSEIGHPQSVTGPEGPCLIRVRSVSDPDDIGHAV